MYMPAPTQGVPNPYTQHVHPWPTRYHGTLSAHRPVFGMPAIHFEASNFMRKSLHGLGNLGSLGDYNTGNGVFRPKGDGGGVFNSYLAGLGAVSIDQLKTRVAAAAAELAAAVGSRNQTRIAAATQELNAANAALQQAQASAVDAAAAKKTSTSSGGATFIVPQPVGPAPMPAPYTSGGMSDNAKYALYGGVAAAVAAVGYYLYQRR